METHIYIAIDSISPKPTRKHFGYVLECMINGEAYTREGFGQIEGTYHAAVLQAMAEALGRFTQKCKIHIHTEDDFVLNMMESNLERWARNGFMTTKGKPVANSEQWKKLWPLAKEQELITETGTHAYSSWLRAQIEKEATK